jgi:hypothetical protein
MVRRERLEDRGLSLHVRPDPEEGDYEEMLAYVESGGTTKVPDGYTPPFYKADRIAEYRQAHAAFTARLEQARPGISGTAGAKS